jgi:uncharacterized protein (TIGR03067 family)
MARQLGWILMACLVLVPLRSPPAAAAEEKEIDRLIQQLGDDEFTLREAAGNDLEVIGEPALPALRKAATADDPEIRRRAEQIARAIVAGQELKGLQGKWHSTSAEAEGVRQAGENMADRHTFAGDQWIYQEGDMVVMKGKVNIVGVSGKLVKIDFLITEGHYARDTWVGIYEREGNALKWCGGYAGEGCARPMVFATRPGDGYFLRTLQRDDR